MRQRRYREVVCSVCGKKFITCSSNAKACSAECRNAKRRKAAIDEENHQQRLAYNRRKHPNRPKTLSPTEHDLWDLALEASRCHTSYGKLVGERGC